MYSWYKTDVYCVFKAAQINLFSVKDVVHVKITRSWTDYKRFQKGCNGFVFYCLPAQTVSLLKFKGLFTHTHTYTHTHTHTHTNTHTHTHTYTHSHIHTHTHTHTHTRNHSSTRMHTHARTHEPPHTHTHTHIFFKSYEIK